MTEGRAMGSSTPSMELIHGDKRSPQDFSFNDPAILLIRIGNLIG